MSSGDDDGERKPAGELRAGDELLRSDSAGVHVTTLDRRAEAATVYNFEVAGNHDYFVGQNGSLVHNSCVEMLEASEAAFRAADNVGEFTLSAKHLPGAGGRFAKFAAGINPYEIIQRALRSPNARFLPNAREGAFQVIADVGATVGTKGQTAVKVVVGWEGHIWTAYPFR